MPRSRQTTRSLLTRRCAAGLTALATVAATLVAGGLGTAAAAATGPAAAAAGTAADPAAAPRATGKNAPVVTSAQRHDTSAPLRSVRVPSARGKAKAEVREQQPRRVLPHPGAGRGSRAGAGSAAVQRQAPRGAMPDVGRSFEGVGNIDQVLPPDTNGDVGPNNYVQWVNSHFAVFDKAGNTLLGPLPGNALWQGFGGPCETHNDGDPVALYDPLADRWFMSQFAIFTADGNHQCIAVSQTGDPTGAWYRYDFLVSTTKLNDYPKFGVWPDAYYMSINQFEGNSYAGAGAAAFERAAMLAGQPARMVFFDEQAANPDFGGQLPSDVDGINPPPAGTPNTFLEADDDASGLSATDRLAAWEFHVDWSDPTRSTFGVDGQPNQSLETAPFDSNLCNFNRSCIPQPATSQRLDAISDRLMFRAAYRNYGDHSSIVVNHSVDADGTDHAGVRWYELRSSTGAGDWGIHQQGTYAPDGDHRWMGSAAMDASGNMAVGFSVSSATTYPSIRIAGRLAGDPLGELAQGETTMQAGSGSQTNPAARWGDYSMLSVDPTDDCTFWYTSEYLPTTSNADWHTRIGTVRFPSCTTGPHGDIAGTVTDATTGDPIAGALVTAGNASTTTGPDGTYRITLPVGSYDMTASAYGYRPQTVADVEVTDGGTTDQDFALEPLPTAVVSGTVRDGSGHGWPLYARVEVQGVPGGAGTAWTSPFSGHYSLRLPQSTTYTVHVESVYPGYLPADVDITVGNGNLIRDFTLEVDPASCSAPGYRYRYDGLYEDFSSTSTPPGWSVVNATDGGGWQFDDPGNRGNLTGGDDGFAVADSDALGIGNSQDTSLVSPVVDLSGTPAPVVAFNTDYRALGSSTADVDVTTDGGATWTTVWHRGSDSARGPRYEQVPLTAAAGQSAVQVRFRYTGTWAWWWEVDNVLVGNRACAPVSGGLVAGFVRDANTNAYVNGATVTSVDAPGDRGVTMATPDDPNIPDGFYWLFSSLTGRHSFTAKAGNYTAQTRRIDVAPDWTTRADFRLTAGRLTVAPTSLESTQQLGTVRTQTLTMRNTGTAAVHATVAERPGGFTILRQRGAPLQRVKGEFSPDWLGSAGGEPDALARATAADAAAAATAPYAPPWTPLADYPGPVMDNAVAPLDGRFYSVGGTDGGSILRTGAVYDPQSAGWTPIASMGEEREKPSMAALGGKLYVTGGWGGDGNPVAGTEVFDPGSATWSDAAPVPHAYAGSGVATLGTSMYVVGGCSASACGTTDVQVYDAADDTWTAAAAYPQPASWLACAGLASSVVCAGGNSDAGGSSQRAYSYDPGSDTWTPVADVPIDLWAMGYAGANGLLLVSGGVTNGNSTITNAGYSYDPQADAWSPIPNSNNTLYRGGSACGFVKVGGSPGGFNPVPAVELLPGFDTCGAGADVPWLSEEPTEVTIAPGESSTVTITFDARQVAQPGDYTAQLVIGEDTPYTVPTVDVTMHVTPPRTWGKITGTVRGIGCTGGPTALPGATVQVDSWAQSYTLRTDADGHYALWLDRRSSPLTLIVAKDGWQPQTRRTRVTPLATTVEDFTLKTARTC